MPRKRAIGADQAFIDARPVLGGAIIKSAQRVIQLFELFGDVRIGLTVADVASRLSMPQSSASALLRSLDTLGYLRLDSTARRYSPTIRLALMGSWIEPMIVRDGPVIRMMRDVAERTGISCFIAMRNRLHVQVAYRENAKGAEHGGQTGAGGFLAIAATGKVLISRMDDAEVARLVHATNAQLPGYLSPVAYRELLVQLENVRRRGFAHGPSQRSRDMVTIAVPLHHVSSESIAFGMSVPGDLLGDDPERWAGILQEAVCDWLGAGDPDPAGDRHA